MSPPTLPIRDELLAPLTQIDTFSELLLQFLSIPSATLRNPLPPHLSDLLGYDLQLANVLREARWHQGKQKEIEELTQDIFDADAQLRDIIGALASGKEALEMIVADGEAVLAAAAQASTGAVSYKTILNYASNLAKFTSAPPSIEPLRPESILNGIGPINPPFPTVEMMRRGKMNFEAPLGSLGEIREIGRASSPTQLQGIGEQASLFAHGGPTQYSTYAASQQHASGVGNNPDDLFDLDLNPDF